MSRMKLLWITKINFKDLFLNLINIFTSPNPNLDPTKIYTGTSKFNPKLHIHIQESRIAKAIFGPKPHHLIKST